MQRQGPSETDLRSVIRFPLIGHVWHSTRGRRLRREARCASQTKARGGGPAGAPTSTHGAMRLHALRREMRGGILRGMARMSIPENASDAGGAASCLGNRLLLRVNGRVVELEVGGGLGQVDPAHTLAHTLRETLGLTGTKISCDRGVCGSCTVLLNGQAVLSCMTLTVGCHDQDVTTIEGLADPETGRLSAVQEAFIAHGAFQCGFCTPGMIMSAEALLAVVRHPDEDEVKEALSGNFCRCGAHHQIVRAVLDAAGRRG